MSTFPINQTINFFFFFEGEVPLCLVLGLELGLGKNDSRHLQLDSIIHFMDQFAFVTYLFGIQSQTKQATLQLV